MKRSALVAVAIALMIVVVGMAFYALGSSQATSSTSKSTSTPVLNGVLISADNATYNSQTGVGTWKISLKNTGGLTVTSVTVYLLTPVNAYLCSGSTPSAGLFFKNCPVTIGSPLPPGATLSGSSTGAGPESASVGTTYPVAVHLAFNGGMVLWLNSTVTVTSG
jgi:hypothetical protein